MIGSLFLRVILNTQQLAAPTIKRRIAIALYEILVLLGVWALGYLVPSLIIGLFFNTTMPKWLAFAHVYLLFGIYFTWYWKKTGQTLAMQTWRVKLVDKNGALVSRHQALKRYAYASLWLLPTIIIYGIWKIILGHAPGLWPTIELMFAMVLFFWPITCILDSSNPLGKQSLVDRMAGTRLVQLK